MCLCESAVQCIKKFKKKLPKISFSWELTLAMICGSTANRIMKGALASLNIKRNKQQNASMRVI